MASGLPANESPRNILIDDSDRELRQVGLVDARHAVTYTGSGCFHGEAASCDRQRLCDFSGNILAGPKCRPGNGKDILWDKRWPPGAFTRRTLRGDRGKRDKRGSQSAAILCGKPYGGEMGFTDLNRLSCRGRPPRPCSSRGELRSNARTISGKVLE